VSPGDGRGSAHDRGSGGVSREAEQRSRAGARGGRRGKEVRRTSLEFEKNLRDFTVNRIFPLIQSSNEEMSKIKVVEFFKSFNFALGFKFKNPKINALFYPFALKSDFIKFFCP
jgi:hypothetical protein